jgi:transcription-repair coupling factor (superfamily II helicase)
MLERTIAELRGEEITDETNVSINLGVDVAIPKDYIADTGQRLRTYKRISSADSEAVLMQIRTEVEDRYGKIPRAVDDLFAYARLRRLADSMYVVSVDKAGTTVAVKLGENSKVSPDALLELVQTDETVQFSPNGILRVPIDNNEPLMTATAVLEKIRQK